MLALLTVLYSTYNTMLILFKVIFAEHSSKNDKNKVTKEKLAAW